MIQKIKNFIHLHKIATAILAVILLYGLYWTYGKLTSTAAQTTYVLSAVTKGTITSSVSGTGQVSAFSQVDVKANASANITSVAVKNGQSVKAGALLVHLDTTDADKAIRDAKMNLESAKISYAKLTQKADALTLLQAKNAITDAESALTKLKASQPIDMDRAKVTLDNANTSLGLSNDDVYNAISAAFLDLPDIMTSMNDILQSYDLTKALGLGEQTTNDYYLINKIPSSDFNIRETLTKMINLAEQAYRDSKAAYDANFTEYKSTSRSADPKTLAALIETTLVTVKSASSTLKQESNAFDYWVNYQSTHDYTIPTQVTQYQTDLGTLITQTNQMLTSLQNAQSTYKSNQDAATKAQQDLDTLVKNQPIDLVAAEANVKEKKASQANLVKGADPLDVQSSQLSVTQKQNSLTDAITNLENYSVTAPFDGIVTNLTLIKGQPLSSGTTVATLITSLRLATISLNEVDIAKIKLGDKATITFDAIPDLTIAGQVMDIDMIGAVSQGVVTYNVKIGFDTQDDRVKVGMSVSASIITDVHQDVLLVPNSAVKAQGSNYYVEMFDQAIPQTQAGAAVSFPSAPRRQPVQTGLSDDNFTEITSGLNEGDQVVTKTNTATTTKTATTTAPSLLPTGGGTRGVSGGGFRPGG